jgi:hypothetical protein
VAIEANQIHINTQGSYQQFDFNSGQLAREAAEANGWCQGTIPVSLNGACQRFSDTQKSFAQHVISLRAAYTQLEAVWTSERREQDAIVQASQVAVQ